jgi:hypothetical protein
MISIRDNLIYKIQKASAGTTASSAASIRRSQNPGSFSLMYSKIQRRQAFDLTAIDGVSDRRNPFQIA